MTMTIPMPAYTAVYPAPFAMLGIMAEHERLVRLDFLSRETAQNIPRDPFVREVIKQLRAYFKDSRFRFDLETKAQGTDFQRRVWRVLQSIPTGKVLSYGEVAKSVGADKAARAVGGACRRNPVSIVVPCHRVVAANGLGGFSGRTRGQALDRKRWLLRHENAAVAC